MYKYIVFLHSYILFPWVYARWIAWWTFNYKAMTLFVFHLSRERLIWSTPQLTGILPRNKERALLSVKLFGWEMLKMQFTENIKAIIIIIIRHERERLCCFTDGFTCSAVLLSTQRYWWAVVVQKGAHVFSTPVGDTSQAALAGSSSPVCCFFNT